MPLAINGFKVCSKNDCIQSGQPQPIDNFSNHHRYPDGKQPQCKTCLNLTNAKYRKTKARKVSQTKYNHSAKARATNKIYSQTERYKINAKHFRQSEKGKALTKRTDERARAKPDYPIKAKAHSAVSHAVNKGLLPKVSTLICPCGKPAQEYHHYLGYEKDHWLDVQPYCCKCHRAIG